MLMRRQSEVPTCRQDMSGIARKSQKSELLEPFVIAAKMPPVTGGGNPDNGSTNIDLVGGLEHFFFPIINYIYIYYVYIYILYL